MRNVLRNRSLLTLAAGIVIGTLVVHAQTTQPSGATGTWKWTVSFGGNDIETTLRLKQDGDKVTGTITGFQGNESEIQGGTVKDGKLTFKVVREFGGQTNTTTYNLTLSGDSLKGKSETVSTREIDAKRSGE
jgi:hypothetical protein